MHVISPLPDVLVSRVSPAGLSLVEAPESTRVRCFVISMNHTVSRLRKFAGR